MVFNNSLLLGSGGQGGTTIFDSSLIGNSVWLDGSADYLEKTFSSAPGSQSGKRYVWAVWVQPPGIFSGTVFSMWSAGTSSSNAYTELSFYNQQSGGGDVEFNSYNGGASYDFRLRPTQVFRDVGWQHFLVSYDSTQAVASNRIKIYFNGKEITSFAQSDYPSLNHVDFPGTAVAHTIGARTGGGGGGFFKDYMTQQVFLDSKSIQNGDVTITDFLDTFTFGTNGSQFVPKKDSDIAALATTADHNSFCLDFADTSNFGNDISDNTNDFTANSMAAANQSTHTPSKVYPKVSNIGIPSGDTAANYTMTSGSNRMVYSGSNQSYFGLLSTQVIQSDDSPIYWEYYLESGSVGGASGGRTSVGLCVPHFNAGNGNGFAGAGGNNPSNLRGVIYDNGSQGSTTASTLIGVGDVQNLAYEPSTGKIWFGVNGTWNNGSETASTTLNPSGHDYQATVQDYVFFIAAARSTDIGVLNFGDNPTFSGNETAGTETDGNGHGLFKYAVPSGFFAPVSANLTAPDYQGKDYFDATLYEGNGTGQRVGDFVPFTDVGTISQSVAFNLADSDKLTIASSVSTSPTNVQKKTVSCWLKPLEVKENWIIVGVSGSDSERIYSNSTGQIQYLAYSGGGTTAHVMTTGAFLADSSQWVHVVVALDYTDGSTEADRVKIYVNGVRQTDLAATTYPANNMTSAAFINKASTEQIIGKHPSSSGGDASNFSNMYYAEYFMVDGHQLDASVFGQLDTSTNRWVAKSSSTVTTAIGALSGGFGNCGFYLDFSNTSDYGEDDSGNNRDFTESGVLDATNQFADTPSSNFATIDPIMSNGATPVTLSKGNLTGVRSSSGFQQAYSSFNGFRMQENTGIYFAEVLMGADSSNFSVGVLSGDPPSSTNRYLGQDSNTYGYAYDSGNKVNNGTGASYGATYTSGDVIGIEIDTDTGSINFHKNGSDQGQAFTAVPGPYSFAFDTESGGGPNTFNFGQQMTLGGASTTFNAAAGGRFKHTPPTGAKALNQDNLDDTASKLTAWAWIKNRDRAYPNAEDYVLVDRVRGIFKVIPSNETDAETTEPNTVQRFFQRGVQVGSETNVNRSGDSHVLWQWLLGDSATTGTAIPADNPPSLASTSLVADAGHFAVISYTGNATSGATIGHGMSAAPEMLWVKERDNANGFIVSSTVIGFDKILRLDTTDDETSDSGAFNSTAPSATLITLGSNNGTNRSSGQMICYAFRSVPGVCKIGSYIGNGSTDGPYIATGFKPRWVIYRVIDSGINAYSWTVVDTARSPINGPLSQVLHPNADSADGTTSGNTIDVLSDGWKRRDSHASVNQSGKEYIYMAMADIGGNGTLPPIYGR